MSDLRGKKFNAAPISEAVPDSQCPVGQSLKKVIDDNGDIKYYVTPGDTCDHPENAAETAWRRDMQIPLPLSWIDPAEAVVFACDLLFVQRANPQGKTYCLDTSLICPIDIPIVREKRNDKVVLVDPERGESCIQPALTSVSAVDGPIIMLECTRNSYSAPIKGAGEAALQCESCPIGHITTTTGNRAPETCVRKCPEGQGISPNNPAKCEPCSPSATYDPTIAACRCNPGSFGEAVGKGGCQLCPVGSYCDSGLSTVEPNKEEGEFVPFRGLTEPMVCPDGLKSTGSSCACPDSTKMFDLGSESCVPIYCVAGQILDGGVCKPCPAGSYCTGGDATAVPTACSKGSHCPEGSSKPTPCGEKYCPKDGMAEPQSCPAGSVCRNGDIGGCTAGNSFNGASCATCRAGHMCPVGVEQQCPMMTFQASPGKTACTPCPTAQVAKAGSTACVPGTFKLIGRYTAAFALDPGTYRFEVAGGGGGGGAGTCNNCGGIGFSGPGGNGELVTTNPVTLAARTSISVTLGHGGAGGFGNDPGGVFDGNTNKCHFTCSAPAQCRHGGVGGTTTINVAGQAFAARGGGAGRGKHWLGFGRVAGGNTQDYNAAQVGKNLYAISDDYSKAPRPNTGNGLGGKGGEGVGGGAWNTAQAAGNSGAPGWVNVFKMDLP